ncbi:uncharacterized protein [Populus alba]|nr:heavy metal-associated isoprenylated plant protein 25-like [Populus alba]KAJ7013713.1 heavy metal-associated isoprenylated plant protein 25-like [Populus alba x Populus x berolinensis]
MMTVRLSGFCDCEGCWRKVNDALSGIKGIKGRLIDKKKFLVTVTGTVDTEALKARLAKIRKGVKVEVILQGDGEKKEEETKPKEEANFNGPYNDPQPYAYFNGPYNDPQLQCLAGSSGPYNDPQPYAYFNGPYNDPSAQGLADGSKPYSYPPAQDHAHGNGSFNYHPSQDFADEISNACSIM